MPQEKGVEKMKKLGISIVVLAMVLAMIGGVNAQNVLFQDDFENIAVDVYPSANGWKNLFSGSSAYVSDEQANSCDKSFKLTGYSSWARSDYVTFSQPDRTSYEVYVYLPELNDVNAGGFGVARGNMGPLWNVVRFWRDGNVYFAGQSQILLQTYSPGRWYKVHVDLDYTTNTGDVYIDDVLKANDVGISPREFDAGGSYGWVTLDQFILSIGGYSYVNGPVYFDDVVLSDWCTKGMQMGGGNHDNGGNVGNVGNMGKHCGNVEGNVGNIEGNIGNVGNVDGNTDTGTTTTTNEDLLTRLWQWMRGSGR